jgi:transposase
MYHNNSSVKDWREARRKRAFELKNKGWLQRDIAQALGISEAAVSLWMSNKDRLGNEAWRSKARGHKEAKLTKQQLSLIPELLSYGAEAYGFLGDIWTCARIAIIIKEEFGISYHKAHVSRILKSINWTPQIPIEQASQRNEQLIEEWRSEVWPELKKRQ